MILEDFDDFGAPLGSLFGDIWPLFKVSFLGSFFGGLNGAILGGASGRGGVPGSSQIESFGLRSP